MKSSFDPFVVEEQGKNGSGAAAVNGGADPWSSNVTDAWGSGSEFAKNTSLETTFDSNEMFDFSVSESPVAFEEPDEFFPADPMASTATTTTREARVIHVAIHEQLACLYDGTASSADVNGTIHVHPSSDTAEPFCLIVRDTSGNIERVDGDSRFCRDITDTSTFDIGDHAFRIQLPGEEESVTSPLARYKCSKNVHPIPLLLKSKVQVVNKMCRIGIKIRANPANGGSLKNAAIVLAVPPDIRGDSVKASRDGGVWDGMKRLVSWSMDEIAPGELIEIQAQFQFVLQEEQMSERPIPKFPILARCDAEELFSDVTVLCTDPDSTGSANFHTKVTQSVRILHRKV